MYKVLNEKLKEGCRIEITRNINKEEVIELLCYEYNRMKEYAYVLNPIVERLKGSPELYGTVWLIILWNIYRCDSLYVGTPDLRQDVTNLTQIIDEWFLQNANIQSVIYVTDV